MKSTITLGQITVAFSEEDWVRLMMILGFAHAKAAQDRDFLRMIIRFTNEINAANPKFKPFEEPEP